MDLKKEKVITGKRIHATNYKVISLFLTYNLLPVSDPWVHRQEGFFHINPKHSYIKHIQYTCLRDMYSIIGKYL
jgi:hypothetical protein